MKLNLKTFKKILAAPLCCLLITASCGKDENVNTLPPETQEGKNTFGCLVNNELWKNGNPSTYDAAYGANLDNKNTLTIFSTSGKSQSEKNIGFVIKEVTEAKKYFLNNKTNSARYDNYLSYCSYTTDSLNHTGEVEITRLDREKKIISGRFKFRGIKYSPPYSPSSSTCDSIVTVDQGRFDLKYTEH